MASSPAKEIDWPTIEIQYRAGTRSIKAIAREFGVSDVAIIKRAKRDEWTRDLRAKIQAQADAKVSAAAVRAEVRANPETQIKEETVVEVESQIQARIRLAEREDIKRTRSLAMKLTRELEALTENTELFGRLAELLTDPPEGDSNASGHERQKLRKDLMEKALSLPGRTKVMKDLSDVLKTLIGLEQEAYGIGNGLGLGAPPPDAPAVEVARRLAFILSQGVKAH